MWRLGGVGGLARVLDLQVHDSSRHVVRVLLLARVQHHGRVDAVEDPLVQHEDLAAAVLLGGGAEDLHGEVQLVRDRGQADPRQHA